MKAVSSLIALFLIFLQVNAQTPQVPSGTPGKTPKQNFKPKPFKPDIKFISSRVISVVEDADRHLFETTISVTLKNQGAATPTGFYLDLRSRYGTASGGIDYSIIGSLATIHSMAAGETRTVEYVFAKDITAMGRARLQCMIRADATNIITEADEENNKSAFFYITLPRH